MRCRIVVIVSTLLLAPAPSAQTQEPLFEDGFEALECGVALPPPIALPPPPQCTSVVDGVCRIDCSGPDACVGLTLTCPNDMPCAVDCEGDRSCRFISVTCPAQDYTCEFSCNGTDACEDALFACGRGPCSLDCGAAGLPCASATMTCGPDSCTATCVGPGFPALLNTAASCAASDCG